MFTTFKLVLLPDFNPALTMENRGGGIEKWWEQWRMGGRGGVREQQKSAGSNGEQGGE